VAGFNASGEDAKLLSSTAWLFKIATHRLLNVVKQMPVPPASDIGWKSLFYKTVYDVIRIGGTPMVRSCDHTVEAF
jgi:hypothetical protein